jgi:hypothetical protein
MGIKILYGGRIRPSYDTPDLTDYGALDVWEQGQVLTVSGGKLQKADNTTTGIRGLALEYRRSSTEDPTRFGQQKGKGSILRDEALVELSGDALLSGITFAEGNSLYVASTAGKITNTGTAGREIGHVDKVSADGLTVTAMFQVSYMKLA